MEFCFYRKLADKITCSIIQSQYFSQEEVKRIRHTLVCIFSDLYKFILFLFIFTLLSQLSDYLLAFSAFFLIRPYLSGFHAKDELTCIIISFITFFISIKLGNINICPPIIHNSLLLILPIIGFCIAPVMNVKNASVKTCKFITAFMTLFLLIIDSFLKNQILLISVIQVYLLAICQLIKNCIITNEF